MAHQRASAVPSPLRVGARSAGHSKGFDKMRVARLPIHDVCFVLVIIAVLGLLISNLEAGDGEKPHHSCSLKVLP
jgi:hypothetical protein